ncbi:MAG: hypothetical protein PF590_00225 [Candidatus Delongbacteria bacterium]|jgi:hypothetical protein|nr:hypothetical protein [Candidatus Delongbacteria bacterium]
MNKILKLITVCVFTLLSYGVSAQEYDVSATLNQDSILIGDQLVFEFALPASSADTVVFPDYPEDTITGNVEVVKRKNQHYNSEKGLVHKTYILTSFEEGIHTISSQEIILNPGTDSLIMLSNPVQIKVNPVVNPDTLKVDTTYAKKGGIVVFGKHNFEEQIEQQIPDSVRQSMSQDSLNMLKDTLRQIMTQRFGSKVFRASGLRKETEIAQMVEAPEKQLFVVNHQAILNDYRIPGAFDTVFVKEYDTVAGQQALFTAYRIKDINDELYETPLNFSEILYYIWKFIKHNWWWLTALVLLVLAAIYYFFFFKKDKPIFRQKVKPEEPAHVIAFRELDRIKSEKLWQKNRVKDYYTDLTDTLRHYLENRYDVQAMEKTSNEIYELIDEKNLMDENLKMKMQDILQRSDFVKFAKSMPLPDENKRSLDQAYVIVEATMEKPRDENVELVESELEEDMNDNKEQESNNDNKNDKSL